MWWIDQQSQVVNTVTANNFVGKMCNFYSKTIRFTPHSMQNFAWVMMNLLPHSWQNLDIRTSVLIRVARCCWLSSNWERFNSSIDGFLPRSRMQLPLLALSCSSLILCGSSGAPSFKVLHAGVRLLTQSAALYRERLKWKGYYGWI